VRRIYEELLALPEPERRARVRAVHACIAQRQAARGYEPGAQRQHVDPAIRRMAGDVPNLWVNIDSRDSAQAVEKAVLADYEGSHPLFVNDCCNAIGIESETLLQLFFPEVTERRRPLAGIDSPVSIKAARALIEFEPEYSPARGAG
jgi:hypothetical protein